jgi:hypothetical protein
MAIADITLEHRPVTEKDYERARRRLRRRLLSWCRATGRAPDPDLGEELLHYKWGYLDGNLTRWRCADLDAVYLELFPAKVIVEDDDLDNVLPEAKAFVSFLSDTGLLDPVSDDPEVLCAHLDRLDLSFRRRMADSRLYSFGKRFWLTAAAEGIRPDADEETVSAFIARFNARSLEERQAVLGQGAGRRANWAGGGRFTPPGTPPRRSLHDRARRRR